MLCIEVKGGAVAWNPTADQWTTRDRWNVTHNIKDPVRQARTSKHELLKKLKQGQAFARRWIRARHGVVLPGSGKPPRDLGPDRPLFLFCFAEDYRCSLATWIVSRFKVAEEDGCNEEGLGLDGLTALQRLLALPISLSTPLGHLAAVEDGELTYLTEQQFHLLSAIQSLRRVCIQGGAGTGKTVLAAKLAEMLACDGLQTLLLCYNESLAKRLARDHSATKHLTVGSFHSMCMRMLQEAHVPIPEKTRGPQYFFEEELPEAALALAEADGVRRFDAIVVDEGQDFRELWWLTIDSLLAASGPRLVRVFLDANQRLYGDSETFLKTLELAPMQLSWNLRNTVSIHDAVYRFYRGRPVSCAGPRGEAPQKIHVDDETSARSALGSLLHRLVDRESVDAVDIAVLVSSESWLERLAPEGVIAGIPISDAADPREGCVVLDTMRRFKGLEARIVILIADHGLVASVELCYVALSRGRTRVFIIGVRECIEHLVT